MDQQDETEGRVKVPLDDASGNPEGDDTEGHALRRRRTEGEPAGSEGDDTEGYLRRRTEDAPTTAEGEDTEGYGLNRPIVR